MHKCSAECCDNKDATIQMVVACQKDCQKEMDESGRFMGRQIANIQSRLERCTMDCQDKVKDVMSNDGIKEPSESQMEAYRGRYEECVNHCVDSHIHMIQGMSKKIKDAIRNRNYNIDMV